MIRSSVFFLFLEVPFLAFFSLTHKEEEEWSDRTHSMLFTESSCVCMPSFRSVAPLFFSRKSTIFCMFLFIYLFIFFFYMERGVAI